MGSHPRWVLVSGSLQDNLPLTHLQPSHHAVLTRSHGNICPLLPPVGAPAHRALHAPHSCCARSSCWPHISTPTQVGKSWCVCRYQIWGQINQPRGCGLWQAHCDATATACNFWHTSRPVRPACRLGRSAAGLEHSPCSKLSNDTFRCTPFALALNQPLFTAAGACPLTHELTALGLAVDM